MYLRLQLDLKKAKKKVYNIIHVNVYLCVNVWTCVCTNTWKNDLLFMTLQGEREWKKKARGSYL